MVIIYLLFPSVVGFPVMRLVYMTINRWRAAATAEWTEEEIEHETSTALPRRGDQKLTVSYGL